MRQAHELPHHHESAAVTQRGVILGTAAYMRRSRPKAGRSTSAPTSGRSGACFTRCSRERAFPGEHVTETLAKVLEREPDFDALPTRTPLPIRRLLRRCLEKERRKRLESAADVRIEIEDALTARRTGYWLEQRRVRRIASQSPG